MSDNLEGKRKGMVGLLASRMIVIVTCMAIAFVSVFVLAHYFSSVERYEHEIEVLDRQKVQAAALSVAASTASTAISVIPDDIGNPAANELAEISKDLAIVTGAVLLEKYLLTVIGFALFRWLVPICCGAILITHLIPMGPQLRNSVLEGAIKVLLVGVIAWRAIPISVVIVDKINETYDETITLAIDSANRVSEAAGVEEEAKPVKESESEPGNAIDQIGQAAAAAGTFIADTVGSITETVTKGAGNLLAMAKSALTNVTEGFAVLVVTSCVIPILTPTVLIWLVQLFFQPSMASSLPAPHVPLLPKKSGAKEPMDEREAFEE